MIVCRLDIMVGITEGKGRHPLTEQRVLVGCFLGLHYRMLLKREITFDYFSSTLGILNASLLSSQAQAHRGFHLMSV